MTVNSYNRYSFDELLSKAIAPNAQQSDIDTLGECFADYGADYWDGECYDASAPDEPSGARKLRPIIEWDDEDECGDILRYEFC